MRSFWPVVGQIGTPSHRLRLYSTDGYRVHWRSLQRLLLSLLIVSLKLESGLCLPALGAQFCAIGEQDVYHVVYKTVVSVLPDVNVDDWYCLSRCFTSFAAFLGSHLYTTRRSDGATLISSHMFITDGNQLIRKPSALCVADKMRSAG
jgi:hypothetical protein